MTVDRTGGEHPFPNPKAETPWNTLGQRQIVRVPAHLGNLRQLGLELLKAYHVGPLPLQPLLELRSASPDAVHVPGGDFHESSGIGHGNKVRERREGPEGWDKAGKKSVIARACPERSGRPPADLEGLGKSTGVGPLSRQPREGSRQTARVSCLGRGDCQWPLARCACGMWPAMTPLAAQQITGDRWASRNGSRESAGLPSGRPGVDAAAGQGHRWKAWAPAARRLIVP